jgi:hypothetical protein
MNRQTATVAIIVIAVLVIGGLAYWARQPTEVTSESGGPGAPVATEAERAVDARAVIADLEHESPVDYGAAVERAEAFQSEGRLADAQLLYFFAARGGNAAAAFALATMNDPNHHSAASSLLPEPDAFQAYKWYVAAREAGMAAADARLEALHGWAETAAADGDTDADRLLLQWDTVGP